MAKGKAKVKSIPKWKPVEIKGSIFNGTENFEGLAGLEILENYDSSFLLGDTKQKQVKFSSFSILYRLQCSLKL